MLDAKSELKKVLHKFNINGDKKSISIPLTPHFKLKTIMYPTAVKEREYMSHAVYACVVDSLMCVMVCTRPNLSQCVSIVSRYMHDRSRGHWEAVK